MIDTEGISATDFRRESFNPAPTGGLQVFEQVKVFEFVLCPSTQIHILLFECFAGSYCANFIFHIFPNLSLFFTNLSFSNFSFTNF